MRQVFFMFLFFWDIYEYYSVGRDFYGVAAAGDIHVFLSPEVAYFVFAFDGEVGPF